MIQIQGHQPIAIRPLRELWAHGEMRAIASRTVAAAVHFFTTLIHLIVQLKAKITGLFLERRAPIENRTLPDFSNIEEISSEQFKKIPELAYWMVRSVGPYKPMGYIEQGFDEMQEEWERTYDQNNPIYGPQRTERWNQRIEALKNKRTKEIDSLTYDNTILPRNGFPLAYNSEALFEVLQKNQRFLPPDIQKLVQQNDKAASTQSFVELAQTTQINTASLIRAAFGDRHTDGENEDNLPKARSDLARLQRQFPQHCWNTIRNFLVYFHRCTNKNPLNATEQLLSQIPRPVSARVYFIHNSRVYMTNTLNFGVVW